MANTETIAAVKTGLRIRHDMLDADIARQVTACLADLRISGVTDKKDDTDPLIRQACVIWCRIQYANDETRAERLQKAYDALKASMTLSGDYRYEE